MFRSACCAALILGACAGSPGRAADKVRFLSLSEAIALALEQGPARQMNAEHPDGCDVHVLTPEAGAAKGILFTCPFDDAARPEIDRNVNMLLLNVETAYWNLYGSCWAQYSREQGLRFAYETWKIVNERYRVGRASSADLAQARGQYELFRSQRLSALDTVLDNERQLRAVIGMPVRDGKRLAPSDVPTLAEPHADWKKALRQALAKRPELFVARQEVKVNQLNVKLAQSFLLPDLRACDTNAIGKRLDGPDENNALRNLSSSTFNDWTVGLRFTVPTGFRQAHAQLRQAQLALTRSSEALRDQELKAERFLGLQYRRMSSGYAQFKAARAQHEAFAEQLKARREEFEAGQCALDLMLEAQRNWADALSTEYQAVVTCNNARCGFEYAKGTIQRKDHVTFGQGSGSDAVRAVEKERRRTRAQVRHAPTLPAELLPTTPGGAAVLSLPSLWKSVPPLGEAEAQPVARAAPL